MFMMTLGFGLYINFNVNTSWAKIIIFQIIAGIGVGQNFQSPLIALQSNIPVSSIQLCPVSHIIVGYDARHVGCHSETTMTSPSLPRCM